MLLLPTWFALLCSSTALGDDLVQRQVLLLEKVNALSTDWGVLAPFEHTEGDTPVGPEGYGGLELDLEANQLLVYWKYGTAIPSGVAGRIAEVQAEGTTVEVLKSPFSMRDLRNEYREIVSALVDPVEEAGVQSVGPLRGGAGIVLTTSDPKRVQSTNLYKISSKRLASKSKRPPASPIEVRLSTLPILYSRTADSNPYRGGARIDDFCSTGFTVGRLFESWHYLLTAGHCFSHTDGVTATTGAGVRLGTTSKSQRTDPGSLDRIDAILVGSLNCQGGPGSVCAGLGLGQRQIYVGDVGVSEDVRTVKSQTMAVPGMVVCTSGSFSGTRCDIEVQEIDVRQGFALVAVPARGLVRAVHRTGGNASGQGDSGGPVFTPRIAASEVNAAGIIVGGSDGDAVCTNVIFTSVGGNRSCGKEVLFLPILEAIRATDVWLEVQ